MEAPVAQDGSDVRQPGDRVAHVGAGQPVLGLHLLNGGHGVEALQADRVEQRELELVDQLWHTTPLVPAPSGY